MPNDKYEILGVTQDASDEEIRAAYLHLARTSHPDLNPGDRLAESRFKEIQLAYETLYDPSARQRYDLGIAEEAVVYRTRHPREVRPTEGWPEQAAYDHEFDITANQVQATRRTLGEVIIAACYALVMVAMIGFVAVIANRIVAVRNAEELASRMRQADKASARNENPELAAKAMDMGLMPAEPLSAKTMGAVRGFKAVSIVDLVSGQEDQDTQPVKFEILSSAEDERELGEENTKKLTPGLLDLSNLPALKFDASMPMANPIDHDTLEAVRTSTANLSREILNLPQANFQALHELYEPATEYAESPMGALILQSSDLVEPTMLDAATQMLRADEPLLPDWSRSIHLENANSTIQKNGGASIEDLYSEPN